MPRTGKKGKNATHRFAALELVGGDCIGIARSIMLEELTQRIP
jgi:hypothetical protein